MRGNSPTDPAARDLGLRAFAFVAGREDLAMALIETSGASPGDLRRISGEPDFAAFILDFLLADDRRVLDFAAAEGIAPEMVGRVRARLEAGFDPGAA